MQLARFFNSLSSFPTTCCIESGGGLPINFDEMGKTVALLMNS